MDVIEKLYTEWAWRTKTGIPNIKDPEDKKILDDILAEMDLKKEQMVVESSESYDGLIYDKLVSEKYIQEGDPIPTTNKDYSFPGKFGGNYQEDVTGEDLKIWRLLWSLAPPTKSGEEKSMGVGKGEVSLYWLYNYSKSGPKVTEGRVGDDPDLFMDKIGVEVKAYKSGTAQISLGRFGADKKNLQLLSVAFGLNTLVGVLNPGEDKKVINPTNFNGSELRPVFENVAKFAGLDNLDELASSYPIFQTIKDNVDFLVTELGGVSTAEEAAKAMATLILEAKLKRKPGNGGYLTNVSSQGKIHWWSIDITKIKESSNLLSSFAVSQSKIKLNFSKVLS